MHVGDDDAFLAKYVNHPGSAKMRGGIELERIEKIGVNAAQQHIETLQAGDGADVDAVAGNGKVVAFDQEETEISCQRRMRMT